MTYYKSKAVVNMFKDAQYGLNEALKNSNPAMVKNYCRAVALDMKQIIEEIDKERVIKDLNMKGKITMLTHEDFNEALRDSGKDLFEVSFDTGIDEMQLHDLTEYDCWDELTGDQQDKLKDSLPDLRWY